MLLANVAAFVFWLSSAQPFAPRTRPYSKRYWIWFAPLYWLLAIYLLWHISPIRNDGYGSEPGFYWGKVRLPTAGEYYQHHAHFLLLFAIPYVATALVLTVLGCAATPWIANRI